MSAETPWPHAPTHLLTESGTYMVTAGTYLKAHYFNDAGRLAFLHDLLLTTTRDFGWSIEAWAVFSNHYHFVGHSPLGSSAQNLSEMLGKLHETAAKRVNELDRTAARRVWYNFRETRLTYQKSYLARLNYVHQNPVKHGLTLVADRYPWCSAAWFQRVASAAQVKTIYSMKWVGFRCLTITRSAVTGSFGE